jgi:hypothetical protein
MNIAELPRQLLRPSTNMARDACLQVEQMWRQRLEGAWAAVGPDIQTKCLRQNEATRGGSYGMPLGCVVAEVGHRWVTNGGRYP